MGRRYLDEPVSPAGWPRSFACPGPGWNEVCPHQAVILSASKERCGRCAARRVELRRRMLDEIEAAYRRQQRRR